MVTPKWALLCLAAGGLMCALTESASAHGGIFRGPTGRTRPETAPPPDSGNPPGQPTRGAIIRTRTLPGSGPQIPFSPDRWEFWWDYNRDAIVNLRESLGQSSSQQVKGQIPYVAPSEDDKRTKILPFLVQMLRDEDDQVRSAASMSIARLGQESAMPYVGHLAIQDTSLSASTNAVVALGLSRKPKVEDTLLSIFRKKNTSTEIRSFAAVSLALIGTNTASEVLRDALEPKNIVRYKYQVRLALAYAVGLTRDANNAPMIRELLASGVVDDYLMRCLLIQSLGKLGDRAANSMLLQRLSDNDTQIRRSAIIALGNMASQSDKGVIEALVRIAGSDSDYQNRNFAFLALSRIARGGHPAIEKFLMEKLGEVPHHSRGFVALSLGLTESRNVATRLQKALATEKELSLRSAIAMALAILGHTESIPMIRSLFESAAEPVQQGYFALALGMLGDDKSTNAMLRIVTKEVDLELLVNTIVALGLIGDPRAVNVLKERMKRDPDQNTRSAMVYGLGLIGGMGAFDTLREVAQDDGETDLVRAFAVLGVGHLGAEAKIPVDALISGDVNYTLDVTFITELWNLL